LSNLTRVDWNKIPPPIDDGAADHLVGSVLPDTLLPSTQGNSINLSTEGGLLVVYAYPMTGRPDQDLPTGWDEIPGARGCTPQSCAFRDHAADLSRLGVSNVFGLSTQNTDYQQEAVERLHLPFSLLSDTDLELTRALNLPTMEVEGKLLIKRLTMIVNDGVIQHVLYPVFPPDKNPEQVMAWLQTMRRDD